MCNNSLLIIVLIIKIVVLLLIPAYIIFQKIRGNDNTISYKLYYIEIIIIIIFIILRLFGNNCILNSNITYLVRSSKDINYSNSNLSSDPNIIEKYITNEIYNTNNNKNVYYFNNSKKPLKDKKITCKNQELYMENFGNNITSVSILLSSVLDKNIDPIEILNLSLSNNIFDCENGVSTVDLLNLVGREYKLKVSEIDRNSVYNYVSNGGIVLSEIYNSTTVKKNLSCGISTIVIYKTNKENKMYILNPSDKDHDYICPSNTAGYGQIIRSNLNNTAFSAEDLNRLSLKNYSLERN